MNLYLFMYIVCFVFLGIRFLFVWFLGASVISICLYESSVSRHGYIYIYFIARSEIVGARKPDSMSIALGGQEAPETDKRLH